MASFPVRAVLQLRDLFGDRLRRIFARAEKDAEKSGKRMGEKLRDGIGKRLGGGIRKIGGAIGATLGLGAGAGFVAAAQRVGAFEEKLTDVRVQAGASKESAEQLREAIKKVSDETNVARTSLLAGVEAMVNLEGQSGFSADKLDVLARATVSSRAPADVLAKVWDGLNKAFFDGAGSATDMEGALSAAIEAGQQGSIPLAEMGTLLGRVASQFDDVAVSGKAGIADMVAALQVVKGRGFGEASEAATGMNSAIKSLISRADKLKEFKVEVFTKGKDGRKELRDLRSILDQISNSKLARDPQLLQKALGDQEAIRFVGALLDKNVRQKWDDIAKSAANSQAVQDGFAEKQGTNADKINASLNKMNNTMDDAFSPERVALFADALGLVVSSLTEIIDGLQFLGNFIGETAGAIVEEFTGESQFAKDKREKAEAARTEGLAQARKFAGAALVQGGTRLDPDALEKAQAALEEAEFQQAGIASGDLSGDKFSTFASAVTDDPRDRLSPQDQAILILAEQGTKTAARGAPAPGSAAGLASSLEQDIAARQERLERGRRQTSAAEATGSTIPRELSLAAKELARAAAELKASTAAAGDRAKLDKTAGTAPPTGAR